MSTHKVWIVALGLILATAAAAPPGPAHGPTRRRGRTS